MPGGVVRLSGMSRKPGAGSIDRRGLVEFAALYLVTDSLAVVAIAAAVVTILAVCAMNSRGSRGESPMDG